MPKHAWRRLEKRTQRLLSRHLQADESDGGAKCVLGGCQVDALGIFGPTALVFECKTSRKNRKINLNQAVDVLAGRRASIRAAIQRKYGKQVRFVRYIVVAHNVAELAKFGKRKARPKDVFVWTPKYFDAVETLARAINRRALPYLLRELKIKNLRAALAVTSKSVNFPAIRISLGGKGFLYSFFAPARILLDLGYVARLEASAGEGFQRLLNPSRLGEIGRFIDAEGTFKNSVVVSLPKGASFSASRKRTGVEVGTLRIPTVPASLWIIDGQHRIYGYVKAIPSAADKPISVVAVHTSNLIEQGRIFVHINKNQKPVDSNVLWDLYFRLNPTHFTGIVSQLVRGLATSKSSPFRERIFVPGASARRRSSYDIYMANVCDAIVKYALLQAALGLYHGASLERLHLTDVQRAAARVDSRLRVFYRALLSMGNGFPRPSKTRAFLLGNNGLAVFLKVFKETLIYWGKAPTSMAIRKKLRAPLKRYFALVDIETLERNTSSEGGRDGAANDVLLEIQKAVPGFAETRLKSARRVINEDEFVKTIRHLEKSLRRAIRDELSRGCKDWWTERVPDDVREKVAQKPEAKQPGTDLSDLLDVSHYMRIISHNWKNHFARYYERAGKDKQWLELKFREVSKLRNDIFHFHGANTASEMDTWRARILTEDILTPLRMKGPPEPVVTMSAKAGSA